MSFQDRPSLRAGGAIALLPLVYIAIRCTYLDRVVTVDEMHWVARSANFYTAVMTGNLQNTYQFTHPGVTTMWAGFLALWIHYPDYHLAIPRVSEFNGLTIGARFREQGVEPLDILQAMRIAKMIVQAVFFAASLGFIRSLFGEKVMLIAATLIVFDPFLSGLDSLMHVDGMYAITTFAALLSLAWAWSKGFDSRWHWAVSGSIAAASWLSRAQGGLVPAIAGTMIGVVLLRHLINRMRNRQPESIAGLVKSGLTWLGSWAVTSLLMWPALWVNPKLVATKMWDFYAFSASEGHGWGVYFNGRIIFDDPGLLFYPATLPWRLTPVVLIGLVLFAGLVHRGVRGAELSRNAQTCLWIMLSYSAVFMTAMSLSAKKFDRYILSVYPIIALVAACGFSLFASYLFAKHSHIYRNAFAVVTSTVLVFQAFSTFSVFPYRLDYYNPLLGGAVVGQYEMQMGWGQGADQALEYLKRNAPRDEDVIVLPSFAFPAIDWLDTDPDSNLVLDVRYELLEPQGWYESDYFVHTIQSYQRNMRGHNAYLAPYEPVHVVMVEGVEYVRIYTPNQYPFPERRRQKITGCTMDFVPGLRLLQVARGEASFDFYFVTTADFTPDPVDASIAVTGADAQGQPAGELIQSRLEPAAPGYLSKLSVPYSALDGMESGSVVSFTLSGLNAITGTEIPVSKPGDLTSSASGTVSVDCWDEG